MSTKTEYSTNYSYIQSHYHDLHQLYILLIYETLRKWVQGDQIYINCVSYIKERYVFNTKESYIIMTNLMNCGGILSQINYLLPKVYLQHINFNQEIMMDINDKYFNSGIIDIIQHNKIIIMDNFLNKFVVKLLDYLVIQKKVKVRQIKIICITCTNKIIEQIADKHPSIDIYTTKIHAS